jgi:hypothetical protein
VSSAEHHCQYWLAIVVVLSLLFLLDRQQGRVTGVIHKSLTASTQVTDALNTKHESSLQIQILKVTCHTYCYGCEDEHTSVLPTVPVSNDDWKTLVIQLYLKSTNVNNSTSRLTPKNFNKTTLCNSTVETSPLILVVPRPCYEFLQSTMLLVYSPFVILLCLYPFRDPTPLLSSWVKLRFGYFLTHLLSNIKLLNQKF